MYTHMGHSMCVYGTVYAYWAQHKKLTRLTIVNFDLFFKLFYSSCQPLNHQLSQCSNYINDGDVYYSSDQSSHLAAALNATVIVIGSYCSDRAMELLCNYFFPQCVNNNIIPICSSSCSVFTYWNLCWSHVSLIK